MPFVMVIKFGRLLAKRMILLQLNQVWVSCEGEYPADKENIGPISYFPSRGFQSYYFPFTNVKGYLSPVIAIHFERPQSKHKTTHSQ